MGTSMVVLNRRPERIRVLGRRSDFDLNIIGVSASLASPVDISLAVVRLVF